MGIIQVSIHKNKLSPVPSQTEDGSSGEEEVHHKSLLQMLEDAEEKAIKSLDQTPYFWDKPDESFVRKVKMNEERVSPPVSPHESWNEEVVNEPTINVLDLANSKWNLTEFQKITVPNQDFMPQSVAADKGQIYVSDPYNGAIHKFEKGIYLGTWPPSMFFNIPRYVLCVPSIDDSNETCSRYGHF